MAPLEPEFYDPYFFLDESTYLTLNMSENRPLCGCFAKPPPPPIDSRLPTILLFLFGDWNAWIDWWIWLLWWCVSPVASAI